MPECELEDHKKQPKKSPDWVSGLLSSFLPHFKSVVPLYLALEVSKYIDREFHVVELMKIVMSWSISLLHSGIMSAWFFFLVCAFANDL